VHHQPDDAALIDLRLQEVITTTQRADLNGRLIPQQRLQS